MREAELEAARDREQAIRMQHADRAFDRREVLPPAVEIEPGAFQLAHHQFGIRVQILQQQDTQRLSHTTSHIRHSQRVDHSGP